MDVEQIDNQIKHRIRAGMVNPTTLRLPVPREIAREIVERVYDMTNLAYVQAGYVTVHNNNPVESWETEVNDNITILNRLKVLRTALETGDYAQIIENLDSSMYGVALEVEKH